jgi:hypothetical protein
MLIGQVDICMQNDLRLALTIRLYNPPSKIEKRRCNPRLVSVEENLKVLKKSLMSGWNNDLL